MKFYRGSASAARNYVEADRSRADDYYLAEGTGVATLYVATVETPTPGSPVQAGQAVASPEGEGERTSVRAREMANAQVRVGGTLDGDAYEQWVDGYDTNGQAKGRLRTDEHGLRFVEVVVNGPKTWSLAAALHPAVADAYDAAQERAAQEIIGWLAEHSTTRVGPRGRQVQVPVNELEAAVVRHYTSRAGDPHRHLHLQINARVQVTQDGVPRWRGLHSVGVVDSIEAINGIGHAAVMCDPGFRASLAAHGYTLDSAGEVHQLAPFAGAFSARAAQISRNVDRYEAQWRSEHPSTEPGPKLRRTWDRRAWAQARPDKVIPTNGNQLALSWVDELHDLGFGTPTTAVQLEPLAIGRINREAVTDLVLCRLGARRSSWNAADIRGECERIAASINIVTEPVVRKELVEDLTARTLTACRPLLDRDDVPEHIRALTSPAVLAVEADLVDRLSARAAKSSVPTHVGPSIARRPLDQAQQAVVAALAGTGRLVVVEGAAGSGKTTTLAAARDVLDMGGHRLMVVTPTLKAAQVAAGQLGTPAFSAAWLIYQHGYRWDEDGHRHRVHIDRHEINPDARLTPGDLLLVDEAGMLDQDTATALLTIADEHHVRVAFVGDRHQLPAVGRGGVLDHAARWAPDQAQVELDTVHRFSDPDYAELSLLMRTGERAGEVFDALHARGEVLIHPSEVERTTALTTAEGIVVADTREQVAALNAAIRDHRREHHDTPGSAHHTAHQSAHHSGDVPADRAVTTSAGVPIGVGDRVATRRNDRALGVSNRDLWTVTSLDSDGGLEITGGNGERHLPAGYVREHVELAYAFTVHGAQGETVDQAHLVLGEATGAAAAYVAMTRGRHHNTAHLVAEDLDTARAQWVETFSRNRADLGPAHAAQAATDDIDRYGPNYVPGLAMQRAALAAEHSAGHAASSRPRQPQPVPGRPGPASPGISR